MRLYDGIVVRTKPFLYLSERRHKEIKKAHII